VAPGDRANEVISHVPSCTAKELEEIYFTRELVFMLDNMVLYILFYS
jgi:hypothetical protein